MITALPFKENVMVGLTHNEDGTPRIRVPRALKVGIGIPRGKALRVFIHPSEKETPWYLGEGYYDGKSLKEKWHKLATRAECESKYIELRERIPSVPECSYPRKLKFFTFSKPSVTEKGAEAYEPDFDAIEAHGPTPTKIPIIFTSADVLRMNYQMWSATELRCKGDGINAMRSVLIGSEKDEGWKEAKAASQRYFPIINGCKERGCVFAEKKECKPGLAINFQTANHYLIGTTASFHTTGYESCSRTFSSFTEIRLAVEKATGRDVTSLGVYLTMRPYVVHPEGQKASTQQAVHVELPLKAQKSIVAQLRAMFEDEQPRQIAAPVAQIQPAPEDTSIIDAEEDTDGELEEAPIGAAGMANEFYPKAMDEEKPAQSQPPAATATQAKQEAVGEQLRKRRQATGEGSTAQAHTDPIAATPATATVAPAPSQAPAADPLPWKNAADMGNMINGHRFRVGTDAFAATLERHRCADYKTLKPNEPVSLAIYIDLRSQPDEVPPDASGSGDMF